MSRVSQWGRQEQALRQYSPEKQLQEAYKTLKQLQQQLQQSGTSVINEKRQQLEHKMGLLHAISPLNVLSRGYAITSQKDGTIIKSHSQVKAGDEITTKLASGTLTSIIKKTNH